MKQTQQPKIPTRYVWIHLTDDDVAQLKMEALKQKMSLAAYLGQIIRQRSKLNTVTISL